MRLELARSGIGDVVTAQLDLRQDFDQRGSRLRALP